MLQRLHWAVLYWLPQFLQCSDVKRKRQLGMKDNPQTRKYNIAGFETGKESNVALFRCLAQNNCFFAL